MSDKADLTHIDSRGRARMVDVGDKSETKRTARATGKVTMGRHTLELIADGALPKGDVLAVARVAGIMAAKETSRLIPMCHPLAIEHVKLDFEIESGISAVSIEATVSLMGKTGVEMEALTAVSVAALTIYDMCKAVDKSMIIGEIKLIEKKGGKSDWKVSNG